MSIELNTRFIIRRQSAAPPSDPEIDRAPPNQLADYLKQRQRERQKRILSAGLEFQRSRSDLRRVAWPPPPAISPSPPPLPKFPPSLALKPHPITRIQKIVSDYYDIDRNNLVGPIRSRKFARPRQIAIYLARILIPRSLPEIGRRFGYRDHTTILHALRVISVAVGDGSIELPKNIRQFYKFDAKIKADVDNLIELIKQEPPPDRVSAAALDPGA